MPLRKLRAVFARGGTSKALLFQRHDLPADRDEWTTIFLAALGSPDPNGRQLDGMGGGISSLSKVCVIGPTTRIDADVEKIVGRLSLEPSVSAARWQADVDLESGSPQSPAPD